MLQDALIDAGLWIGTFGLAIAILIALAPRSQTNQGSASIGAQTVSRAVGAQTVSRVVDVFKLGRLENCRVVLDQALGSRLLSWKAYCAGVAILIFSYTIHFLLVYYFVYSHPVNHEFWSAGVSGAVFAVVLYSPLVFFSIIKTIILLRVVAKWCPYLWPLMLAVDYAISCVLTPLGFGVLLAAVYKPEVALLSAAFLFATPLMGLPFLYDLSSESQVFEPMIAVAALGFAAPAFATVSINLWVGVNAIGATLMRVLSAIPGIAWIALRLAERRRWFLVAPAVLVVGLVGLAGLPVVVGANLNEMWWQEVRDTVQGWLAMIAGRNLLPGW